MPLEPQPREQSVIENTFVQLNEEHPLRNILAEDTWISSEQQNYYGFLSTLANVTNAGGNGVVKDPQSPDKILSVGGNRTDDGGGIYSYDAIRDELEEDPYPSVSTNHPNLGANESLQQHITAVVGNYIVVIGGRAATNDVNDIMVLDTSAGSPTWSQVGTIGTNTGSTGMVWFIDNGEVNYFLNKNDTQGSEECVLESYNPDTDTLTVGSTFSLNLAEGIGESVVIDGEVYLNGWASTENTSFPLDLSATNQETFLKYDIANETFTRLADNPVAGSGFGWGNLAEYNGNLVYTDGYWYSEPLVGYYSIENDEWVTRTGRGPDPDGTNWQNGNKRGVLINGIQYFLGTGNGASGLVTNIYVPEKNPFDN